MNVGLTWAKELHIPSKQIPLQQLKGSQATQKVLQTKSTVLIAVPRDEESARDAKLWIRKEQLIRWLWLMASEEPSKSAKYHNYVLNKIVYPDTRVGE